MKTKITYRWKTYQSGGEQKKHLGKYEVNQDGSLKWIKWESQTNLTAASIADKYPVLTV